MRCAVLPCGFDKVRRRHHQESDNKPFGEQLILRGRRLREATGAINPDRTKDGNPAEQRTSSAARRL